jgi:hypothetical protein
VGAGGPGMGLSGLKEQKAFEKSIWEKVKRGGGESLFFHLPLGIYPSNSQFQFILALDYSYYAFYTYEPSYPLVMVTDI